MGRSEHPHWARDLGRVRSRRLSRAASVRRLAPASERHYHRAPTVGLALCAVPAGKEGLEGVPAEPPPTGANFHAWLPSPASLDSAGNSAAGASCAQSGTAACVDDNLPALSSECRKPFLTLEITVERDEEDARLVLRNWKGARLRKTVFDLKAVLFRPSSMRR